MSVTLVFVRETAPGEKRAALSPETCKKLLALKLRVLIESGAGNPASFPDGSYVGAEFTSDRAQALAAADILICVQPPSNAELTQLKPGAIIMGLLAPHADPQPMWYRAQMRDGVIEVPDLNSPEVRR